MGLDVGSGSEGGGIWRNVFDEDFSTLANQSLSGDGAKVINGKTWTKSNSAKDRTAMSIVNGQGLVIHPDTNAQIFNGTRNAPLIWLPFSQMSVPAGFGKTSGVRVWTYLSAYSSDSNVNNSGNKFYAGVDSNSTAWAQFLGQDFASSQTSCVSSLGWTQAGSTSEQTDGGGGNALSYSANKVSILVIPALSGLGGSVNAQYHVGADAAAGWPGESATSANMGTTPTTALSIGVRQFPANVLTGMGLFLAAGASASASFFPHFTIARVRVDVRG